MIDAIADLTVANHILSFKGVLDSFGHISVRHPGDAGRYLMSRAKAPSQITKEDILEFTLDSTPVAQNGLPLYAERPIHGCIYQARPDVMAICHNHSRELLPFAVTKTPMRPAIHVAAAIGQKVPVWDIRDEFGDTNLLVSTNEMGHSLAHCLGNGRAALMRGHGSVVVGTTIRDAVFTSYYLQVNAAVLLESRGLGEVQFLSPGEVDLATEKRSMSMAQDRAWDEWIAQVGVSSSGRPDVTTRRATGQGER
jgi:ribulose-5-phosphate 4-epimerase/fuculose-1-phosphate aldolase